MRPDSQLVTLLLYQWKNGNGEALDQLMPLAYDEFRHVAKAWCPEEVLTWALST